jgi:hypothetical protein
MKQTFIRIKGACQHDGKKKLKFALFVTWSRQSGPVEVPKACSLLFSTEKAFYMESYEDPTNSNDKKIFVFFKKKKNYKGAVQK